jgi:hypothetical protein
MRPAPPAGESVPPPTSADPKLNDSLAETVQVGNKAKSTPPDPEVSAHVEAESINASAVDLGLHRKKRNTTGTAMIVGAAAIAVGAIAFAFARGLHPRRDAERDGIGRAGRLTERTRDELPGLDRDRREAEADRDRQAPPTDSDPILDRK